MITAYIAIGSNLSDPVQQTKNAIEALKTLPQSQFLNVSSLYSSTPMGPQDQPDYINAVVEIKTDLSAMELLNSTQAIEQEHGRVRKDERWGPRTLDLDIILYGQQTIDNERLTVPHYGMRQREFVLYPLAEIAPELQLPDGVSLQSVLSTVPRNGLSIWRA
ncbi:2-amino-4-hydroxy-6-hydroxymethyldihydropteridine diphosphokinase [Vibrio palustris]|uniref:2-amino-4-hydroxy-6-hydroxymethyldihydropteridine pyrophosphokinase n=1 Tax=Vibrio palustris TaxID=1918946 RepID=A0A1R4B8U1_9VIBR|nr:2-amino-4-hydroxy-6-hydroxymethyldihydropteridine diphosphokinase [Vibrio palustris]SJL85350.1 2-amino-4-hydroxy-6-hydroxymethyldihydropteridinepyrophosphokinase [Vibrio palustris]